MVLKKGKIPISEGEYAVLKKILEKGIEEFSLNDAEKLFRLEKSKVASIARLLETKSLAKVRESLKEVYVLTRKGIDAIEKGLPEESLLNLLIPRGEVNIKEARITLDDAEIAIGLAKKKGLIEIRDGKIRLKVKREEAEKMVTKIRKSLENMKFDNEVEKELLARGLIKKEGKKEVLIKIDKDALSKVEVVYSRLSHEILSKRAIEGINLMEYNIYAEPPKIYPARKHFFSEFIEMLKDIMVELGFKEVQGPLIELELFNFDLLFQPQDHPAREIHDTLRISENINVNVEGYRDTIKKVSMEHENGWNYKFDEEKTKRLVLRSQTTSVSVRTLLTKPEPPIRFFTIDKVYRSDVVDASHLPEFYQLDGVMGDYGYTFRDLLGFLKEFAERLGLEIKFKPSYFPFTEPSVEGYANINGRWVELFGAGLFRPEVLRMTGVDYPVGAWGMGVERLAMARLGVNDIRLLYSEDYNFLRSFKMRGAI